MATAAETAPMTGEVSGILIDGQRPPAYQFAESGGVVAAAAPMAVVSVAPVATVMATAMPIGWTPGGGMPMARPRRCPRD